VLGKAPADGEPAPGTCETVVAGTAKPPGAICVNDGFSCGAASCTQSGAAGGARVCFKGCVEDPDCDDGYICAGILCLKDSEALSLSCPSEEVDAGPGDGDDDDDEVDGCGCDATGERDVAFSLLAFLAVLGVRRRARR
jgi:uncharacterized protein (TIGR03382 family)